MKQADDELIKAVNRQDVDGVEKALQKGANVHVNNENALVDACSLGNYELVELLLSLGANPRARKDYALWLAGALGHTQVAEALIKAGAQVQDAIVRWTSAAGHISTLLVLLRAGGNRQAINSTVWVKATGQLAPEGLWMKPLDVIEQLYVAAKVAQELNDTEM